MATREFASAPRILPLYARAVAPLLPGASHLPGVGGGGGAIPDRELTMSDAHVDVRGLQAYNHVCCCPQQLSLPATYPHVLAFPLQLALITDRRFPFPAVGLVHIANRITQHRPILREESMDLRVRATPLAEHPRGSTFSLLSEARVAGTLVWEEHSTMLHRERPTSAAPTQSEEPAVERLSPAAAQWQLPADLGRRYAAVSGDRNPIHLAALSARLFGFPRAIAHGMWTLARCVAAVHHCLPAAFSIDVEFRAPILLPATVAFSHRPEGGGTCFQVSDPYGERRHLDGRVEPRADGTPAEKEAR